MKNIFCVIVSFLLILVGGCSTASVRIRSAPSDANIFIDGNLIGKTPQEITLDKRTHALRIEKDGFDTISTYLSPELRDDGFLAVILFPLYWVWADDVKYELKKDNYFTLAPACIP